MEHSANHKTAAKTVYEYIKRNRDALRLEYGNRLPTEEELSRVLETDRFSVRRALRKLVENGLLHSVRNRGYYFDLGCDQLPVTAGAHYHDYCRVKGIRPRAEIVDLSICLPSGRAAEELGLPPNEEVWSITFLRYREALRFSLTRSLLPKARTPGLIGHIRKERSLYSTLRSKYGIEPRRVRTVCSAVNAGIEEARLLNLPLSSALLRAESTAVDQAGVPIEYCETVFRGDVVRLSFDVSGDCA